MGRYDALLQEETHSSPQSPIESSQPAPVKPPKKDIEPTTIIENPPAAQEGQPYGGSNVRPSESAPVRTPVRVKRTITRYAFEFFQDQLETLKGLSIEEQLRGEKGSMSQMVREAVDAYISKRRRTEE